MASLDAKGASKQDMVVSTRYRNDLPPPPMPPKLLDIDNGGLAQYLTTSFASAMARREEPNIEVDAEGGMSIDMIGVPGYFLGDESAIMAPEIQPVLDPADHALMLTPDQLRNQNSKNVNVSFLRKTQYMNSNNARANDAFVRPTARTSKSINKSNSATEPQLSREDPINIRRHIQKGFDVAYPESIPFNPPSAQSQPPVPAAEQAAWQTPTHPDNPRLKPVAYYPILPDLNSSTDVGGFVSIKFDKPPLSAIHGHRDDRVDVALLHATPIASAEAAWRAKKEAHEKNPDLYDDPGDQPFEWDFCVPKRSGRDVATTIKRMFNPADPSRNDEKLYDGLYEPGIPAPGVDLGVDYVKERSFGAVSTEYPNARAETLRFMALELFDGDSNTGNGTAGQVSRLRAEGSRSKAAYYYPIMQRVRVRADRGKIGPRGRNAGDGEESWNHIKLKVRDPTAEEKAVRAQFREEMDDAFAEEYERLRREADAEAGDEDEDEDRGGDGEGGGAAVHRRAGDGGRDVEMTDDDRPVDDESSPGRNDNIRRNGDTGHEMDEDE